MPSTVATVIQRTRRYLRDWPAIDELNASLSSSATSISVDDQNIFQVNGLIEIDNEAMWVRAKSAGSITVRRAALGSTAATHASNAEILVNPRFLAVEILDAINIAKNACFPLIYQKVIDTSLTSASATYEYTVPNVSGSQAFPIPYLFKVEMKEPGDDRFLEERKWWINRGATPKIQFAREPVPSSTIRLHGIAPFADFAFGDSVPAQWPTNAEDLLVEMAAAWLLSSGEAYRVRQDTGAIDNREQANKVGSSRQAASTLMAVFYKRLADAAMPPVAPHIVQVV